MNRQSAPTSALPAGELYWRVRATASATTSPWSTASFSIDAQAGPVQLSPSDGQVLPQPESPPQLTWSPLAGATSYEVEVGLDPNLVGATRYTTRTTSYAFTAAQAPTTWYWHVRGVRTGGQATDWSAERSYRVEPLAQPGLVSPTDSPDSVLSDVVLKWTAVSGAKRYEYRISTDENFNTVVATGFTFATRWSPATTLNNDQYWWQVRAYDTANQTDGWLSSGEDRVWQFQRAWQFDGQLAKPTLLSPENHVSPVTSDPFFFEWEPVRLASEYEVDIGQDPNFSPDTYETCVTQATTLTPTLTTSSRCMPAPANTYYWRVRAIDDPGNVLGVYSTISVFTYRPGGVTQLSPADGETVDIPTMSWEPVPGAEKYRVTFDYGTTSTTTKTALTYSTSYTPIDVISPAVGPIRWRVQAIGFDGDESAMPFDGPTFTLSGNLPPVAAAPDPLGPVDGAHSVRAPQLRWSPVSGAASYRLKIGIAGTGFFTPISTVYEYPAGTDTAKTYLQAGAYDWRVEAIAANGSSLGLGAVRRFVIDDLQSVSGEGVALTGLALNDQATRCDKALSDLAGANLCANLRQTPVLDWDPMGGASYFLVYVGRDRALTNMIYDDTDVKTKNTRWTPTTLLADSQAGQAYYWVIRPCKASGVCAPDPTEATHAFDKSSNAIRPTLPVQSATADGTVSFEWEDYLLTNQEVLSADPETGVQPTIEAARYRVQISQTAGFQAILDTATVDQTTYTASAEVYPDGPLFWRVSALDASSNVLASSEVQQLQKSSPAVTLTSPANNAEVADTPALRWNPANLAASYTVEVYKNDDTNYSLANRVVTASTTLAAYSLTSALPATALPYVWRVRRVDPSGNPGTWSAPRHFTVKGVPPTLTSPFNGENVSATGSLFTWQPVQGASSYRFERRVQGSTSVSETVKTVSLAYAPVSKLPDNTWEWRISTLDTAGVLVAASAWRTFVVDGTAPTVVTKSPASTGTPRSNVKATFSEPVVRVDTSMMRLYQMGQQHPLAARVALSTTKLTATLNPDANLRRGKTYRVRLSSAIQDRAGNPLAVTMWTFTVS